MPVKLYSSTDYRIVLKLFHALQDNVNDLFNVINRFRSKYTITAIYYILCMYIVHFVKCCKSSRMSYLFLASCGGLTLINSAHRALVEFSLLVKSTCDELSASDRDAVSEVMSELTWTTHCDTLLKDVLLATQHCVGQLQTIPDSYTSDSDDPAEGHFNTGLNTLNSLLVNINLTKVQSVTLVIRFYFLCEVCSIFISYTVLIADN